MNAKIRQTLLYLMLYTFLATYAFAQPVPAVLHKEEKGKEAKEAKKEEKPSETEDEFFDHPFFGRPKPPAPNESIFRKYERFINSEIVRISNMDIYGVTAQLPKGYMAIKWDWGMVKATRRFDENRHVVPGVPPIEFSDAHGKKLISLDLGLQGKGGGHTIQVSYGITDPLDWYIEIPFTYMDVSFNPQTRPVDDQGNKIDPTLAGLFGVKDPKNYTGVDFFRTTLPMLGRPTPAVRYVGSWKLGDINTGFSWNYYRTYRMSCAITPRIYFPTGKIADANNSLLYATGPELDVGVGGWGVGATQGYDFRIYQFPPWLDLITSSELTIAYYFPQKREYPTNFPKPSPQVSAIDPTGSMFPDLSGLHGKFTYWPGFSVDWTAQLQIQVAILGLGVAYGVHFAQEPEIHGDARFVQMVKGLQLLGEQTYHMIQTGVILNLLALYVPLEVAFQYKRMVDGRNAIIFDNFFQITFKGYIPIHPDRKRRQK